MCFEQFDREQLGLGATALVAFLLEGFGDPLFAKVCKGISLA